MIMLTGFTAGLPTALFGAGVGAAADCSSTTCAMNCSCPSSGCSCSCTTCNACPGNHDSVSGGVEFVHWEGLSDGNNKSANEAVRDAS
jgi:hypothetical protein